ncbi:hypothetical protein BLNAU_5651 [Blattamonas nauphoetae]|uniref:Polynucleotide adenylyltransferase n=1 Tax=Blattamonas nauphoetae TaxID=2049346 RepID=A0ABQ9Y6F0_9EUKA|nr:hypothetical protein BLNAU_5651 [Blattamonas nauphoetae]
MQIDITTEAFIGYPVRNRLQRKTQFPQKSKSRQQSSGLPSALEDFPDDPTFSVPTTFPALIPQITTPPPLQDQTEVVNPTPIRAQTREGRDRREPDRKRGISEGAEERTDWESEGQTKQPNIQRLFSPVRNPNTQQHPPPPDAASQAESVSTLHFSVDNHEMFERGLSRSFTPQPAPMESSSRFSVHSWQSLRDGRYDDAYYSYPSTPRSEYNARIKFPFPSHKRRRSINQPLHIHSVPRSHSRTSFTSKKFKDDERECDKPHQKEDSPAEKNKEEKKELLRGRSDPPAMFSYQTHPKPSIPTTNSSGHLSFPQSNKKRAKTPPPHKLHETFPSPLHLTDQLPKRTEQLTTHSVDLQKLPMPPSENDILKTPINKPFEPLNPIFPESADNKPKTSIPRTLSLENAKAPPFIPSSKLPPPPKVSPVNPPLVSLVPNSEPLRISVTPEQTFSTFQLPITPPAQAIGSSKNHLEYDFDSTYAQNGHALLATPHTERKHMTDNSRNALTLLSPRQNQIRPPLVLPQNTTFTFLFPQQDQTDGDQNSLPVINLAQSDSNAPSASYLVINLQPIFNSLDMFHKQSSKARITSGSPMTSLAERRSISPPGAAPLLLSPPPPSVIPQVGLLGLEMKPPQPPPNPHIKRHKSGLHILQPGAFSLLSSLVETFRMSTTLIQKVPLPQVSPLTVALSDRLHRIRSSSFVFHQSFPIFPITHQQSLSHPHTSSVSASPLYRLTTNFPLFLLSLPDTFSPSAPLPLPSNSFNIKNPLSIPSIAPSFHSQTSSISTYSQHLPHQLSPITDLDPLFASMSEAAWLPHPRGIFVFPHSKKPESPEPPQPAPHFALPKIPHMTTAQRYEHITTELSSFISFITLTKAECLHRMSWIERMMQAVFQTQKDTLTKKVVFLYGSLSSYLSIPESDLDIELISQSSHRFILAIQRVIRVQFEIWYGDELREEGRHSQLHSYSRTRTKILSELKKQHVRPCRHCGVLNISGECDCACWNEYEPSNRDHSPKIDPSHSEPLSTSTLPLSADSINLNTPLQAILDFSCPFIPKDSEAGSKRLVHSSPSPSDISTSSTPFPSSQLTPDEDHVADEHSFDTSGFVFKSVVDEYNLRKQTDPSVCLFDCIPPLPTEDRAQTLTLLSSIDNSLQTLFSQDDTLTPQLQNGTLSTELISTARIPILKVHNSRQGIEIDMGAGAVSGIINTDFIRNLLVIYPQARPLILLLKTFLAQKQLNHPYSGGLGGYAVSLLVVSHLQQFQRNFGKNHREASFGELVVTFFQLYGEINLPQPADNQPLFSFSRFIITVKGRGCYIDRETFDESIYLSNIDGKYSMPLAIIEDPLNKTNNTAKSAFRLLDIQDVFRRAYEDLMGINPVPVPQVQMGEWEEQLMLREAYEELQLSVRHKHYKEHPSLDIPQFKLNAEDDEKTKEIKQLAQPRLSRLNSLSHQLPHIVPLTHPNHPLYAQVQRIASKRAIPAEFFLSRQTTSQFKIPSFLSLVVSGSGIKMDVRVNNNTHFKTLLHFGNPLALFFPDTKS